MLRGLIKAVLLLVIVVAIVAVAGAYFLGYRIGGHGPGQDAVAQTTSNRESDRAVATGGRIDTDRAREQGAQMGEKFASLANRLGDDLSDGAITAKIKSKLALDDTLKASDIHVATDNGAVTMSGTVRTETERSKAMSLARETDGVKSVADRLQVQAQGKR